MRERSELWKEILSQVSEGMHVISAKKGWPLIQASWGYTARTLLPKTGHLRKLELASLLRSELDSKDLITYVSYLSIAVPKHHEQENLRGKSLFVFMVRRTRVHDGKQTHGGRRQLRAHSLNSMKKRVNSEWHECSNFWRPPALTCLLQQGHTSIGFPTAPATRNWTVKCSRLWGTSHSNNNSLWTWTGAPSPAWKTQKSQYIVACPVEAILLRSVAKE